MRRIKKIGGRSGVRDGVRRQLHFFLCMSESSDGLALHISHAEWLLDTVQFEQLSGDKTPCSMKYLIYCGNGVESTRSLRPKKS